MPMSAPVQKCHYCDQPGDFLCDFPLSLEESCDRPMCKDHRQFEGSVRVCMRPRRKSYSDSIDHCMECRKWAAPVFIHGRARYRQTRLLQRRKEQLMVVKGGGQIPLFREP